MQLRLVDVLQCPNAHESSSLIATIDRTVGGTVERGSLGCPICDARFAIEDGAIVFAPLQRDRCRSLRPPSHQSPEQVLRAAALLGLIDPGGLILLGGEEAALAEPLRERAGVSVVLYNPPGLLRGWEGVTPIFADTLPVTAGAIRGAIVDTETAGDLGRIAAMLTPGARLVAPAGAAVPPGMRELARDEGNWVAERMEESDAAPVPLRRGGGGSSATA